MTHLNRKRILLGGLLLACSGALCGCTEELYELEPNEEEIIVNYAAHIVSKYNTEQPEGYQYVYVEEEASDKTTQDDQTQASSDSKNTQTDSDSADASQTDSQGTSQTTDAQSEDETADSSDASQTQDSVSLSEALGLGKLRAIYTGYELVDSYGDTVVADEGKELLVLHIALQNPTNKKKNCDLLALLPEFRVTVNGSVQANSQLTILSDNLATWEEPLSAGAIEDTVILFQVDKDAITQIDQMQLEVKAADQTAQVILI